MNSRAHDIEVFLHVAKLRSFTRAARGLSLTVSAVSRAVTRLEEHLAIRLLNRTTRLVTLTEAGETFFERCRHVFDELHEAEESVARQQDQPRGAIRISLPVALGVQCIVPRLQSFTNDYPRIQLDVSLSDRIEDLAQERTDAALRVGSMRDGSLLSRRLGSLTYTLCASPDYLARRGQPTSPGDLAGHNCLAFVYPQTRRSLEWSFRRGAERRKFKPDGTPAFDNGLALVEAARSGVGLVQTQTPLVAPSIQSGALVPLLGDWKGPSRAVQLLYTKERHPARKLQVLIDYLTVILPDALALESAPRPRHAAAASAPFA